MGAALSKREHRRLADLEAVVERGLATFIEVGTALLEIRDSRLYRETHETFEAYCQEHWGKGRRWAYQLIDAAEVCALAHSAGLPVPANEAQARELAPLLRAEGEEAVLDALEKRTSTGGWRTPKPGGDEWYTRPEFIEAARAVLGGIDLDPASCALAQKTVKAARHFTSEDDGLAHPWTGRVFLNPPFSNAKAFGEKLLREYETGNVEAAIMVVNSYSADTKWFQPSWKYLICISTRPAFYNPDKTGNPTVWAAFVYLGPDPVAFSGTFRDFGYIVSGRRSLEELLAACRTYRIGFRWGDE